MILIFQNVLKNVLNALVFAAAAARRENIHTYLNITCIYNINIYTGPFLQSLFTLTTFNFGASLIIDFCVDQDVPVSLDQREQVL